MFFKFMFFAIFALFYFFFNIFALFIYFFCIFSLYNMTIHFQARLLRHKRHHCLRSFPRSNRADLTPVDSESPVDWFRLIQNRPIDCSQFEIDSESMQWRLLVINVLPTGLVKKPFGEMEQLSLAIIALSSETLLICK